MPRLDHGIGPVVAANYTGGGTIYLVESNSGALYMIVISAASEVVYYKSTDRAFSWAAPVSVKTGVTVTQLSIWYDRWSGIATDLIHIAYTDTTSHDALYKNIDTASSDTQSSETVIFAGASAVASNGGLSIGRARGGNLYCGGSIDAGAENFFARSTDVGATWGARTDTLNEGATADQLRFMLGWGADNQDVCYLFHDASTNELTVKTYDNSGDTWSESAPVTIVETVITGGGPMFNIAPDLTNSRNMVIVWTQADLANADLKCYLVDSDHALEAATDVVLNSTDDQGYASLSLDTANNIWHAVYAGASGGGETFQSSLNLYEKISTDGGTTWGAETLLTQRAYAIRSVACTPRFSGGPVIVPFIYQDQNLPLVINHNITKGGLING